MTDGDREKIGSSSGRSETQKFLRHDHSTCYSVSMNGDWIFHPYHRSDPDKWIQVYAGMWKGMERSMQDLCTEGILRMIFES